MSFVLDYNYDWNYAPFWTLEDSFGKAWADDFDAYTGSAVQSYRAYGWLERPKAISKFLISSILEKDLRRM